MSESGPRVGLLSIATGAPPHQLTQSEARAFAKEFFAADFTDPGQFEALLEAFSNAGVERRRLAVPVDWLLALLGGSAAQRQSGVGARLGARLLRRVRRVSVVRMASEILVALASAIVLQRALELRLARRNERWARAQGAKEHGRRHYPLFFLLHGGWLVGWLVESYVRGVRLGEAWGLWLTLFSLASVLRYWAIATLGRRWNTRILVLEGHAPIRQGPYRYVAHPNYMAVALELFALPMMFGAWWTAGVASVLNLALLVGVRIPVEERALREAAPDVGPPPARS